MKLDPCHLIKVWLIIDYDSFGGCLIFVIKGHPGLLQVKDSFSSNGHVIGQNRMSQSGTGHVTNSDQISFIIYQHKQVSYNIINESRDQIEKKELGIFQVTIGD